MKLRPASAVSVVLIGAALGVLFLAPGRPDLLTEAVASGWQPTDTPDWARHTWTPIDVLVQDSVALDVEQVGFRVGALTTSLELAGASGDSVELVRLRGDILSLLAAPAYLPVRTFVPASGSPPAPFFWTEVEDFFGAPASLGRGLEAMRLAVVSGNHDFLRSDGALLFAEELVRNRDGLPGQDEAEMLLRLLRAGDLDAPDTSRLLDLLFLRIGG